MVPQIHDLLPLFTFFLCMILVLSMVKISVRKTHKTSTNLPPRPWKLPLIGNIHHLVTSTPHRKLRDLAITYGPLMRLQLGEVLFIIISSAEYATEVLKTHDIIFASRPRSLVTDVVSYDATDIAFSPYGDYLIQLRKICTMELLSSKQVKSLWPVREKEISTVMKSIASKEGSEFNITQAIISISYTITSKAAFGKKYEDQQEVFISVVKQLLKLVGGFYIGDLFPSAKWLEKLYGMRPKLERLRKILDRIAENIIIDHKEERLKAKETMVETKEDLIDVLLKYEEDSSTDLDFRITTKSIMAIILDVFSAGSETASATMNWAMAEMIKDPRVLKKAQVEVREVFDKRGGKVDESGIEELKYLKAVIKEVLRLHPPAPLLIPRECGEACEIKGFNIPVKTKIVVNAWAISRDPEYWSEPDKFDPERFIDSSVEYKGTNFEYIPFGAGRRMCPGMNYGMANVEQVIASLLYHFDWRLPNGIKNEDLDMTEEFGITISRRGDLYLIPVVSRPLPT